MNTEQQQRLGLIQEKVKNKPRNYHTDFHFLLSLVSSQEETRGSRIRRMNHEDYQRIQESLDSLPDCPTEEEAEAVLRANGTSGKEVVNQFIERLLRENLQLKGKLAWTKEPPAVDGVYWWRLSENDPDPDICETDLEMGFVYDIGDPVGAKISARGGEWLGPVTPTAPVLISPLGYEHAITIGWNKHNARRHELIEAKRSRSLSESEMTELAELQWLAGIKRELQTGPTAANDFNVGVYIDQD